MSDQLFEQSRLIDAPPARVWEIVADYARDHEWRAGVRMTAVPAGLARDGTVTHEEIRVLGSVKRVDAVVHDVVPGKCLHFRTTRADMPARGMRRVEAEGDGSRFTLRIEVELSGLMAVFRAPVASAYRRRLASDLERLARLVESHAALADGDPLRRTG